MKEPVEGDEMEKVRGLSLGQEGRLEGASKGWRQAQAGGRRRSG